MVNNPCSALIGDFGNILKPPIFKEAIMIKKIHLDNGVRLVYEHLPQVRSVSTGIWVAVGSRNETNDINGISHYIEHMLFKGTKKRSAKDIAYAIDSLGGQINAFTAKENTCYYTKTLDAHIQMSFDILSDMFFNSKFLKKDLETEKKVIFEEIKMYEDTPEEHVHDLLLEKVWEGDAIGMPILGTFASLGNIGRQDIVKYMKNNYTPERTVISVAGNFDEKELIALANRYFGSWKSTSENTPQNSVPVFNRNVFIKQKDTEQVHMCLSFDGIPQGEDYIYSLLVLNNVLGGGMSSRLFQKIREEKGLVYSIYSYPASYKNTGIFTIYAGMNPAYVDEVIENIQKEINDIINNGITNDEFNRSKEQLKGNYILGLESTSGRMSSIGKSELILGYVNTPDEILDKIDKVSLSSLADVVERVLNTPRRAACFIGSLMNNYDDDILNF